MALEDRNIRQIVKILIKKNAFIEYDPNTGAYKLHNILLEFLRKKLETSSIGIVLQSKD